MKQGLLNKSVCVYRNVCNYMCAYICVHVCIYIYVRQSLSRKKWISFYSAASKICSDLACMRSSVLICVALTRAMCQEFFFFKRYTNKMSRRLFSRWWFSFFYCDILNLNLVFVKGAIWQHSVTESLLLLTDHVRSRLGKFLCVSLVRESPAAWRDQRLAAKMVGPRWLVQSDVKCRSVTAFKELTSKGMGERHENSPADRTEELIFFCFPVLAAF